MIATIALVCVLLMGQVEAGAYSPSAVQQLACTDPPGEALNLLFATKERLVWNPTADAATYCVVRGGIEVLPVSVSNTQTIYGGPNTFVDDPTVPPVGRGFFYLVQACNSCGCGTWGYNSTGTPRIAVGCP